MCHQWFSTKTPTDNRIEILFYKSRFKKMGKQLYHSCWKSHLRERPVGGNEYS